MIQDDKVILTYATASHRPSICAQYCCRDNKVQQLALVEIANLSTARCVNRVSIRQVIAELCNASELELHGGRYALAVACPQLGYLTYQSPSKYWSNTSSAQLWLPSARFLQRINHAVSLQD
jgi:hypothetical protein